MKSIYNALYLSIFLNFLRVMHRKFFPKVTGLYCLYVPRCGRKYKTFTVLVAKSPDIGTMRRMSRYLESKHWDSTIALEGCYFPDTQLPIIPLNDPELKDLSGQQEYGEIAGALDYADIRNLVDL